jgi:hypothetical protein
MNIRKKLLKICVASICMGFGSLSMTSALYANSTASVDASQRLAQVFTHIDETVVPAAIADLRSAVNKHGGNVYGASTDLTDQLKEPIQEILGRDVTMSGYTKVWYRHSLDSRGYNYCLTNNLAYEIKMSDIKGDNSLLDNMSIHVCFEYTDTGENSKYRDNFRTHATAEGPTGDYTIYVVPNEGDGSANTVLTGIVQNAATKARVSARYADYRF